MGSATQALTRSPSLSAALTVDQAGHRIGTAPTLDLPFGGSVILGASETDGIGIDFTDSSDARRVAKKVAGVTTNFGIDASGLVNASTASPKLVMGNAGRLVWSPHNLFLNSGAPATQSVTTVVGMPYTVKVTGTGSMIGSGGAVGLVQEGAPLTFIATTTSSAFNLTGSLTTIQMNQGYVATEYLATTATRRIGVPVDFGRWLISEPSTLNSAQAAADFSNPLWFFYNSVISTPTDGVLAPDGRSAQKWGYLADPDPEMRGQMGGILNTAGSITGRLSVYAKAAEFSQIGLWGAANTSNGFDLDTGTTFTILYEPGGAPAGLVGADPQMEYFGDGWWRCSVAAVALPDINFGLCKSNSSFYGGALEPPPGHGMYIWGPQLEPNPMTTSFVPTFGVVQTRAADNITMLTSAYPWSAAGANSIVFEAASRLVSNAIYMSIHNGTDAERYLIDTSSGTKLVRLTALNLNVVQTDIPATTATPVAETFYRAAMAMAPNDFAISVNGSAVGTDALVTLPTGCTTMHLGASRTSGGRNIRMRNLKIVPRRMTNVELPVASTPT